MSNLLRQAVASQLATLRAFAADTVVYRAGDTVVSCLATQGQTEFEVVDGSGLLVRQQSVDWIIDANQLITAAGRITPARGHTIEHTAGDGTVHVYTVMAPGKEPAYRAFDPYGSAWRIHTKHTATR